MWGMLHCMQCGLCHMYDNLWSRRGHYRASRMDCLADQLPWWMLCCAGRMHGCLRCFCRHSNTLIGLFFTCHFYISSKKLQLRNEGISQSASAFQLIVFVFCFFCFLLTVFYLECIIYFCLFDCLFFFPVCFQQSSNFRSVSFSEMV